MNRFFVFLISLIFVSFVCCFDEEPIVATIQGDVRGFVDGFGTNTFLGIPYAAPPINGLRFENAQEAIKRDEVFDAKYYGYSCPQTSLDIVQTQYNNQSESCLTLNIWSPDLSSNPNNLKPVMFFIFGGGFKVGSSNEQLYNGTYLSFRDDVLVVTFNYRLGALGFLALDSLRTQSKDNSTGNYGFTDQQMALKWVQNNIVFFGGDPNRVYLFGQSAGGNSVLAHYGAPGSKGLFNAAGSESGYFHGFLPLDQAYIEGEATVQDVGCSDSDNVVECLKNVPYEEFLNKTGICFFLPAIGDVVLPMWPEDQVMSGDFSKVPLMIGSDLDDGSLTAHALPGGENMTRAQLNLYVKLLFPQIYKDILAAYPLSDFESPYWCFDAIFGDWNFHCTSRRFAKYVSQQGIDSYLWLFSHPLKDNTFYPPTWNLGAYHGSEIPFVFQSDYLFTQEEEKLKYVVSSTWTSFAKDLKPTIPGLGPFPVYSNSTDLNINFNITSFVEEGYGDPARCDLWDSYAQEYGEYTQQATCKPKQ